MRVSRLSWRAGESSFPAFVGELADAQRLTLSFVDGDPVPRAGGGSPRDRLWRGLVPHLLSARE